MLLENKLSQSATEFVVITTAVLFVFSAFFLLIQENLAEKTKENYNTQVKEIAMIIQDEINLASIVRDGYEREFKLPEKINNKDYTVEIIEEMVYVRTDDSKHAIALPVQVTNGNIIKGTNRIKKENGKIYLN